MSITQEHFEQLREMAADLKEKDQFRYERAIEKHPIIEQYRLRDTREGVTEQELLVDYAAVLAAIAYIESVLK